MLMNLNKWVKLLFILLPLSLLTACSVFTLGSGNANVSTQLMPLLPVPADLQNRVWLEKFTFSFDNTSSASNSISDNQGTANDSTEKVSGYAKQSMLLQTELTEQGISIAAMSFDGIPLAQASWQSGSQSIKSELTVAKNFDAKQVLHDLQAVNWPIELITSALATNFSVDEQSVADPKTGIKIKIRHFYHQGEVIIIIRYQQQDISFEQVSAGYRLLITRLTDNDLNAALK
ncbi:hypothetical protein CXF85_13545 [Colwellia sp. 75C3]|uniref:DUF3261 domain-containing protein n=1 Tax=Colwellia sp. 75C3 TaxID=888425 RepID=UPI000C33E0C0|nr:DUF3261 domain-containing protein [Colwellia sp. 75C3]PKG82502.1 hypothetical protein CXF85_13545 [Colwellia sp. 75C3]